MKKIAIAASLIAAVALGAFARGKFVAQNFAYYADGAGNCKKITATTGNPFDAVGTATQAAIVDQNNVQRLVYTDALCTAAAKFIP